VPITGVYRAKRGSSQALTNPDAIKTELFRNGPVVAVFRVFADFILSAAHDGFAKTQGIYTHVLDTNVYGYGSRGFRCAGSSGGANLCYLGNHAVVIVGWGKSKTTTTTGGEGRGGGSETQYWIVRNSWGPRWNRDGYFKIAFSDPKTGVNMECALDRPLRIGSQLFGGALALEPLTESGTHKSPIVTVLHPITRKALSGKLGAPKLEAWALGIILAGAFVISAIVLFVALRQIRRRQ
jgi:hypothetical protein